MVSKVENVDPKVPKQAEAKRDGVIKPQNYNWCTGVLWYSVLCVQATIHQLVCILHVSISPPDIWSLTIWDYHDYDLMFENSISQMCHVFMILNFEHLLVLLFIFDLILRTPLGTSIYIWPYFADISRYFYLYMTLFWNMIVFPPLGGFSWPHICGALLRGLPAQGGDWPRHQCQTPPGPPPPSRPWHEHGVWCRLVPPRHSWMNTAL